MTPLSIVLISVLGFFILVFVIGSVEVAIALSSSFTRNRGVENEMGVSHKKEEHEDMISKAKQIMTLDYQPYTTKSFDGLELFAKFYKGDDRKPYVILMHGYRGVAERDFGYIMPMLMKNGYNILLTDERACGKSEGHSITFGIKERKDVRSWSYFLLKTFGRNISIALIGVSMGAASVLMASELNLPHAVKCIVADCPYTRPREIIKRTCKSIKFPSRVSFYMIKAGAFLYAKMDIDSSAAVDAVRHTDIPILLLHGEKDDFVPAYMSKEIQDNCFGYVERHTFKEADHGYSSLVEPQRYERILIMFLEKYCK